MDITFEDVAHVIQDARYQQAILDTSPKPDKRIPGLPRGYKVEHGAAKVNCGQMMSEPLGWFFLGLFCDIDEKVEEYSNKAGSPARGQREESKYLKFVAELHETRRHDPDNVAPFVEILRLLRLHNLDKLSCTQAYFDDPQNADTSTVMRAAMKEANSPEFAKLEAELTNEAQQEIEVAVVISEDDSSEEDLDLDLNDEEVAVRIGANRERETQVTRYGRKTGAAARKTGGGAVRATAGAGMMTMVHGSESPSRKHTARSLDLNKALQRLTEAMLTPAFDRLLSSKAEFLQYCRFKEFSQQPVGDRQLRYHRVLGQGAFGTVHGCVVAQTGKMLAMKIMSKKRIKLKHSKSQVVAERFALEALARHPTPYCMRLRYAFQTKESFHLLLPLAIGGDLKYHLRKGPFDEKRAKFYAAEIAVGVGHIHSLGFIMRDLKPRNILLDSDGHCKISDFGLAANIANGATVTGRAGTEGYWSPEVINGKPYGVDADWWSFGCCLFELLAGFNPFSCKHTGLATRNEGTRSGKIKFTKQTSPGARLLISSMLDRDIGNRLGCGGEDVDEVLSPENLFWRGIDMANLKRGTLQPPWIPEKGVIYAAPQSEIMENDDDPNGAQLRKVKLGQDDIPEFVDFVDMEDHMKDLVEVIPLNSNVCNVVENIAKETKGGRRPTKAGEIGKMFPEAATPSGCGCIIA